MYMMFFEAENGLFYKGFDYRHNDELFEELRKLCEEKAQREKVRLLNRELEMIKESLSAPTFMIAYEIAELSRRLGYPARLVGNANGLYVARLLGMSYACYEDYNSAALSSEIGIAETAFEETPHLELRIAPPVRKHICNRLRRRFCHYRARGDEFYRMTIVEHNLLEEIGALSAETGVPYYAADCVNEDTVKALCDYIRGTEPRGADCRLKEYTLTEAARLIAFKRCNHDDSVRFEDVREFVFREDFYRVLKTGYFGCPADEECFQALRFSRIWESEEKKARNIQRFTELGLPAEMIYSYANLTNCWPAAECLSIAYLQILRNYLYGTV